jgi:hypothetical protein
MIRLVVAKREPLRAELDAFIETIRTGSAPLVGAADSLRALAVAQRLVEAGSNGRTLHLAEREVGQNTPALSTAPALLTTKITRWNLFTNLNPAYIHVS